MALLLLIFSLLFNGYDGTLLIYHVEEDSVYVVNPRRATERFPPYSTFKVFNALVALETGAMPDADRLIPYDAALYPLTDIPDTPPFDHWRQSHNLRSAMQYSVVWFYTEVAKRIGQAQMQHYLDAMPYGNADASAWLTPRQFWLGAGLTISAWEQMDFLRRLLDDDLPFAPETMATVREIIILEETSTYTLSGKTGTQMAGGLAWFIGYLQTETDTFIIVLNVDNGPEVRNQLVEQIVQQLLTE